MADALLGAAGKRDLGSYFADTDPGWAGVSSLTILRLVNEIVAESGYKIINIDSVIMAQRPRLSPYIKEMREIIAETLALSVGKIAIKATTTETLGFVGRGEGIAAQAVCLLHG
ncbi:MAG TPA: 2-C-methyl-D-erythritol 2,4-cyclodiphosphate synthase, partial [bacterium]|nr:2-C-methyl-D-erythritol 2,4-cyclodiphosphate synthase [bacterium]